MGIVRLLLQASWKQVAIAVVTGGISGACSAGAIALIDRAMRSPDPSSTILPFFVLSVISLVAGMTSQFLLTSLSQGAIYNFRLKLSEAILASPLSRLERLGSGSLLATLTGDVATLSNTIVLIPFVCIDLAMVAGCLIYLASLSGIVFAIASISIVMGIFIIQSVILKANLIFRQARQDEDRLLEHFRSITDGVKELKLNQWRRAAFIDEKLAPTVSKLRRDNVEALNMFSLGNGLGQFIFFAIIGIIVFVIPQFIKISPAILGSFVLTITYLMLPFGNIIQRLPMLFRANVSIKKIEEMGLKLADRQEENQFDREFTFARSPQIQLSNVEYTYTGEDPECHFKISDIDLNLNPGELIFIVGGNGSGKSTLAKIITGLYPPDRGEIKLNNVPITNDNREWYRQHFAVVFADFYLFDRLLGIDPDRLDKRAQAYLELLQLDGKVQIENGLLSTTALSQGQRKRLALLTAYLDERPIYLFDEWAADQDPVFRDIFYHQLLPKLQAKGKLILAISHDDRYFHLADRVIKLDYGKIESDSANGEERST
jgi:putative pyoverdin transport system ATP-binding/permease protein